MRILLTGGVRIESGDSVVEGRRFPGRLGRLAFAYLAVERDRPVPREELAETLWSGQPPATWEKGISVLMSRLRGLMTELGSDGRELLTNAFGCYQLRLPAGTWIDVVAMAEGTDAAEAALRDDRVAEAVDRATAAAELARREFLPGEEGAWVEARRDQQRRLLVRCLDCLSTAQLRLGGPRTAVVAAAEAVALEPYRESGYVLLMRAHAAVGDRAQALRVHEDCRRLLSDELGVDPSPETEAVHLQILRSRLRDSRAEPAEAAPAERPAHSGPAPIAGAAAPPVASLRHTHPGRRNRALLAAAVVVLAGGSGAIAVHLRGSGTATAAVIPGADTVARVDASGQAFSLATGVGERPVGIAVTGQRVWAVNYVSQTISWLDRDSGAVLGTRAVGGAPTGIAAGDGAVWVTAQFGLANGTGGSVLRFDPNTAEPSRPIAAGDGVAGIAFGAGALWVTNSVEDTVFRIDPTTEAVGAPIHVGREPGAIAADGGSVWVANTLDGTVSRIDANKGVVVATIAAPQPSAVAADASGVWVLSTARGTLTRLDPTTNGVLTTLQVGAAPAALCLDGASVWVSVGGAEDVVRLDAASGRVTATLPVHGRPDAIDAADGTVWVAVDGA